MLKAMKRIGICLAVAGIVWCGTLLADRQQLREELVRLHVVANSDTEEDQALKLKVRDAVTESLQQGLRDVTDPELARTYIREHLSELQQISTRVLRELDCEDPVRVCLSREEFPTRNYDTFSLPAGLYDALRIVIGTGEGHNWWCVAFPSLCLPASAEGFEDVAAGAGFSQELIETLQGEKQYEIRFFLLDALGRLENFLAGEK